MFKRLMTLSCTLCVAAAPVSLWTASAVAAPTGSTSPAGTAGSAGSTNAPGPTATAPRLSVERLPVAADLMKQGLGNESPEALARLAGQLLSRLKLDDQHLGVGSPRDLHDLILLATCVQLLERAMPDDQGVQRAALDAAYLIHMAGYAYDEKPMVHATIDGWLDGAGPDQREAFQELVGSVRQMRELGKEWFPNALYPIMKADPSDAQAHNQRGLWLLRENRLSEAVDAFTAAVSAGRSSAHALNLYEALVAAERSADSEAIYQQIIGASPSLRGRLDEARRRQIDILKTESFETHRADAAVDEHLDQLFRYFRRDRPGAAAVLAREVYGAHPKDPKVRRAVAEILFMLRSSETLETLMTAAEKDGPLDERLREVRIAMDAHTVVDATQRGLGVPTRLKERLATDLDALVKVAGPRGELVRQSIAVFVPIARWMRANSQGAMEPPKQIIDAVHKTLSEGFKAVPGSEEMMLLALAAYVGIDRPLAGVRAVGPRLNRLTPEGRVRIGFLLAQIEAGYAARRRDKKLMRAAQRRLKKVLGAIDKRGGPPEGLNAAVVEYQRLITPMAARALDGRSLAKNEKETKALLGALDALTRLELSLDEATNTGRAYSLGLRMTAASLLLAAEQHGAATRVLGTVQQRSPDSQLGKIAGGIRAVIAEDSSGADRFFETAMFMGPRASLSFIAAKWLLVVHNDPERRKGIATRMLGIWEDAHAPDKVEGRSPRPLLMGDFNVGLVVARDTPLAPDLQALPVLLLVADPPSKRSEIEAMGQAETQ